MRKITYNYPSFQMFRTGLYQYAVKRLFDIVISLSVIMILFPIYIGIAILIKIDDPEGTVIFRQERIGKNGETFIMYKFRSMKSNAEEELQKILSKNEVSGLMFKMKSDPRITNIGKFIRKTSLDELPQLINVLKGDMTLVGPRPAITREVSKYNRYELQRLVVTPGCTGLWQVSGRNNLSFEEMVDIDLEYIERLSVRFDLVIILKTFLVMVEAKAY